MVVMVRMRMSTSWSPGWTPGLLRPAQQAEPLTLRTSRRASHLPRPCYMYLTTTARTGHYNSPQHCRVPVHTHCLVIAAGTARSSESRKACGSLLTGTTNITERTRITL